MECIQPHPKAGSGQGPAAKEHGLVRSKIVTPRSGLIERPRLLAMASQLLAKRLAVIKHHGFGKTSLAMSWSSGWPARSSVAWLTIDTDDNEPSRFSLCGPGDPARCTGGWCRCAGLVELLINPRAIVSS
jgi:hypothetical protein